ncbi:MAG: tetratricopeptide repeat protein [Planctomycetes bacterium]|nr:tetratricopeptide repeat protein [Planctomycetota bacterium]
MPRGHSPNDALDCLGDPLGKTIEVAIYALLIFMPLAFGAVHAWSEFVVCILSSVITLCFLGRLIYYPDLRVLWSWAYVPISVFVLLIGVQLIELPFSWIQVIAPGTAALKQELLRDLPGESALSTINLTFYGNATWHDLRLLLSVIGVFVVVLNTFQHATPIKRLLTVIVSVGACVALIGLAQIMTQADKIYWLVPSGGSALANAGPFVCHSHFSQFITLSLGAAFGLLLVSVCETFGRRTVTVSDVSAYLSTPDSRPLWLTFVMIVFSMAAIFLSLSRGGMIGLLVAISCFTVLLSFKRSIKGQAWVLVLMCLITFVFLLYAGFDAVYDRLATLGQWDRASGGRWQIVKDIAAAAKQFPFFGTGLGTHRVVYPMFDSAIIRSLATHAENEYAQLLEETGLIGLLTWGVFGFFVCRGFVVCVKKRMTVPIQGAAYGLGFGLLAIMVHSVSDFGQHLPANAFLSAIFCALLLVLERSSTTMSVACQQDSGEATRNSIKTSRSLRGIAMIVMSFVWMFILFAANSACMAESNWRKAAPIAQQLKEDNWLGTDQDYVDLLNYATRAREYQFDNVTYCHWLNVYKWNDLCRATDPKTGQVPMTDQVQQRADRIMHGFNQARLLCPTYGPSYCVLGAIERQVFVDDSLGRQHIQKGYALAPNDATVCFVAGCVDADEQRPQAALAKFARALQLDGSFFDRAVNVCLNTLEDPEIAIQLAGTNSGRLNRLTRILAEYDEFRDAHLDLVVKQTSVTTLKEKLEVQSLQDNASAGTFASLASIYVKEDRFDDAIDNYKRALDLDYDRIDWRLRLARLLEQTGDIDRAIHQARICLRLRTAYPPAEELIKRLSVKGSPETK